MNNRHLYLNGEVLPASEARISPLDRGFLLGDGVFETTRVVNATPFRLADHLSRLEYACKMTNWGWKPDRQELRRAVKLLVDKNDVTDGYMRVTVSRGRHDSGLTDLKTDSPTILVDVHAADLPPLTETPPIILTPAHFLRNDTSPVVSLKSVSYQSNLLALARGREAGADEVVFTNTRGNLAEGAISNIFLVQNDRIITPAEDEGVLPGIGRKVVLEICQEHNIPVRTGSVISEKLYECEEIFCTNSLRGVMPVEKLIGARPKILPSMDLSIRLRSLFGQQVAAEVGGDDRDVQV